MSTGTRPGARLSIAARASLFTVLGSPFSSSFSFLLIRFAYPAGSQSLAVCLPSVGSRFAVLGYLERRRSVAIPTSGKSSGRNGRKREKKKQETSEEMMPDYTP